MLKEHLTESAQEKTCNLISDKNMALYEKSLANILRYQGGNIEDNENVLEHTTSGLDLGNAWFDEFPVLGQHYDQDDFQVGYVMHDGGEGCHGKGRNPENEKRAVARGEMPQTGHDLVLSNPEARAAAERKERLYTVMSIIPRVKDPKVKAYLSKITTDYFEQRTLEARLVNLVDKVQAIIHVNTRIIPEKYVGSENTDQIIQDINKYGTPSYNKAIDWIMEDCPEEVKDVFLEIKERCDALTAEAISQLENAKPSTTVKK